MKGGRRRLEAAAPVRTARHISVPAGYALVVKELVGLGGRHELRERHHVHPREHVRLQRRVDLRELRGTRACAHPPARGCADRTAVAAQRCGEHAARCGHGNGRGAACGGEGEGGMPPTLPRGQKGSSFLTRSMYSARLIGPSASASASPKHRASCACAGRGSDRVHQRTMAPRQRHPGRALVRRGALYCCATRCGLRALAHASARACVRRVCILCCGGGRQT
jgi:hypothetical protein